METIVALASGNITSAISLIRVSGEDAIDIVNRVFSKDLHQYQANTVVYGFILDEHQEKVDEVMVSIFHGPKSFTGENMVEVMCHGGIYITNHVLESIIGAGANLAMPGAFSQRAFMNGRIDLTQAEAIMDIIEADSQQSAKLALNAIHGSIRKLIVPLKESLLEIIANIEVNIDYPEYDQVEMLTNEIVLPKLNDLSFKLDEILKKSASGKIIREGIQTVIIGKPNVGKSSLLNALLEEDKAIVSNIEGTTRDIVEGHIRIKDITLKLLDTAGLRNSHDVIENIGIDKTKQAMNQADLIIVLLDGSKPLDANDEQILEMTKNQTRIIVYNKADIQSSTAGISISAKNHDIEALTDQIYEMFKQHLITIQEPTLANVRHIGLIKQATIHLNHAKEAIANEMELDLVNIDLQLCYTALQEIMGDVAKMSLVEELFSRFCLGK